MNRTDEIANNVTRVMEKIHAAANRSGRDSGKVKLVVVSKGQSLEVIQAAIAAGVQRFGENYPEETIAKIQAVPDAPIEWHMIGHLQSRKAKMVCQYFTYMHSLDSLQLAEKMERLLAQENRVLPVLLEFNVGAEESKSGWLAGHLDDWQGFLLDVEKICALPHLQIRGLMTMPPLMVDQLQARVYFKRLAELQDYFRMTIPDQPWDELSMGTSSDFEVAVEEGATYVRIGTSILGRRPVKLLHQDQ